MRKLSRKKAHRASIIRNLATSLLLYESIDTTEAKAKTVRPFVERIISRAKKNDLSARKFAASKLFDKNAVNKLFSEIIPRYENRNSGYTRVIKTGFRPGDNADTAKIELVDKKVFIEKDKKIKTISEKPTKELKAKTK